MGLLEWLHSARLRSRQLSSRHRLKPKLTWNRNELSGRLGYASCC